MSRSRKLFIAAALLAAGYGVATLLGSPNVPYLPRELTPQSGPPVAPVAQRSPNGDAAANPSLVGGGLRLLPDTDHNKADLSTTVKNAAATTQSQMKSSLAAEPDPYRVVAIAKDADPPTTATQVGYPATASQVAGAVSPPPGDAKPKSADPFWDVPLSPPANRVTAAAFDASDRTSSFGSQATFNAPIVNVESPPWPADDEPSQRTHIIVDGDSLAKLAGRYLNDPQRGAEIFALNRGILTSPDLLPIGAELRIPPRQPVGTPSDTAPTKHQGAMPVDATVRSGMVPVRPIPSASTATPHARLLRPMAAESSRAAN